MKSFSEAFFLFLFFCLPSHKALLFSLFDSYFFFRCILTPNFLRFNRSDEDSPFCTFPLYRNISLKIIFSLYMEILTVFLCTFIFLFPLSGQSPAPGVYFFYFFSCRPLSDIALFPKKLYDSK